MIVMLMAFGGDVQESDSFKSVVHTNLWAFGSTDERQFACSFNQLGFSVAFTLQ